jgi:hypothetical protein
MDDYACHAYIMPPPQCGTPSESDTTYDDESESSILLYDKSEVLQDTRTWRRKQDVPAE